MTEQHLTKVLIVDDHVLIRKGLCALLESEPDICVIGEASDGVEGFELTRKLLPDVVLMDITMPNMNGIEATQKILATLPDIRIIALSLHGENALLTTC